VTHPADDPARLHRNRDFVVLQVGQLLSAGGSQLTTLAYPLLVLSATGSAAKAGLVWFARLLPLAAVGLLAGVVVDRVNRRRLMIAADLVRAAAIGSLGVALVAGSFALWHVVAVALIEGVGGAFFAPAAAGALRAVVPRAQLPAAAGVQEARHAAVELAGPPIGGALFAVGRAVPFVVDAVTYVISALSLTLVKTPFQGARETGRGSVRSETADGFRFLWTHAFLRTCALLWALGNFLGPGLLLIVVVQARREGQTGAEIGLLLAAFGAAILVGSLVSPVLRRRLSMRTIVLLELWAWLGCFVFIVEPRASVLIAAMIPCGLLIPVSDSVVTGYRLAITPPDLIGRVEGVRTTLSAVLTPFGPLAAGLLLGATSARFTVVAFAGVALGLAVWGSLSPAIRDAPSLDELQSPPPVTL
jgi:Transmembrane secretion effector